MMKKMCFRILVLLCAIALCAPLSACGSGDNTFDYPIGNATPAPVSELVGKWINGDGDAQAFFGWSTEIEFFADKKVTENSFGRTGKWAAYNNLFDVYYDYKDPDPDDMEAFTFSIDGDTLTVTELVGAKKEPGGSRYYTRDN